MASAVRALSNWKQLGPQLNANGKSRSDVYDQFISDVCEYYGYNQFLAEKLVELFPIEEVGEDVSCAEFQLIGSAAVHRLSLSWTLPILRDLSLSEPIRCEREEEN